MILQSFKMAWKAIVSSKMRSFLTMLGIIIGIVSLVVLVSIANGATSSVTDQISNMGTNLFTVSVSDNKNEPFKIEEVDEIAEDDSIAEAAPLAQSNATAENGYTSGSISLSGTTASYDDIQELELSNGRFLKNTDVDNHSYVIVINEYAATELLGHTQVVGESISIDGIDFQIIGVLAEEDSTFGSDRMEGYIPYTTLMRISSSVTNDVTTFYASSADEDSMDEAESYLTSYMMKRLKDDEEAFSLQNQSTLMDTMSEVNNTLTLMIGGIAAIALLVGGIGIMNIMLVSVTERTREIGIRKAIGANRISIMMQFLIEALVISLMGCMIGIGLSFLIIQAANLIMGDSLSASLSSGTLLVAVAFSVFIGVVFGLYPANKAAKKKPIDALRFN